MWKFIQRKYYEWVIRNCVRDISELKEMLRSESDPYRKVWIQDDIREARSDMDNARNNLSQLTSHS